MSDILLNIKNVTAGYRKEPVLKDIDLSVAKGDLVGIIGPNGSGKTTLLKASTRILKPWAGDVLINDRSIWDVSRKELAREIAVVSQGVEPVSVTVYEYILLGRFPYYNDFQLVESSKDEEIAHKYMELTGTMHLKDAPMSEISGGERQLAQIARALTQEPEMVFLDEPTAHLDITHQVKVLDLIKHLNSALGLTVLMVLHDLNLASEYCSRLALLDNGRIYKTGTPHEVLTYEVIEEVYKTPVVVEKNPLSNKPFVLLVTAEEIERAKENK
jgi:iron complex transport system ATP-binding protein